MNTKIAHKVTQVILSEPTVDMMYTQTKFAKSIVDECIKVLQDDALFDKVKTKLQNHFGFDDNEIQQTDYVSQQEILNLVDKNDTIDMLELLQLANKKKEYPQLVQKFVSDVVTSTDLDVIIKLDDLKTFYNQLDSHKDEWYGPINFMTIDSIVDFLNWNGNNKLATELTSYVLEQEKKR